MQEKNVIIAMGEVEEEGGGTFLDFSVPYCDFILRTAICVVVFYSVKEHMGEKCHKCTVIVTGTSSEIRMCCCIRQSNPTSAVDAG